ncbi:uncharacterized protein LOC114285204 [Camellia sinensis]|uniref:uncharacterized protein LOC114285204 n=1 Tax=Camellia sinensis TaxID=4442 RepID=UPI0010369559|nr:uncharacterized protein LOC114285204 [Camellia sinensis]
MTQIDSEDAVPISKLAEVKKSQAAAEKRPVEADVSDSQPPKRLRSDQPEGSCSFPCNMTWAPEFMAKATRAVQGHAEAKAEANKGATEAAKAEVEAVKAKAAKFKAKLNEAIKSNEEEVKAADEKAFEEGQAAICDQYKEQVNKACNRVPFPPKPKDFGDEANEDNVEDSDADEEEKEAATDAMSPTLNEQVLDLTQDEEDDLASKGASPKPTTTEAEVQCAEKSLDQTLLEINAKIAAKKNAMMPTKADTTPIAEVE